MLVVLSSTPKYILMME